MEKGIKVGDRVRVSEDAPRIYTDGWRFDWRNSDSRVGIVEEDDAAIYPDDSGEEELTIPCKYLVKVDTEAEEDARIRQKEAELEAFSKSELDRVLYPEKYHTYEVAVDNVAMDWQRYEADLAKELALKVANKFNDPKEAAEYAVSVAKSVVKNLKEIERNERVEKSKPSRN